MEKDLLKNYIDRDFRFAFRVVYNHTKEGIVEAKRPRMLDNGILLQRWSNGKEFWVGFFMNGQLIVYDSDVICELVDIIRARKR